MTMRKTTALLAGGIGYVLGARAGRERYEQIRNLALRIKDNPTVQQKASQTADLAKDAAATAKDKATGSDESTSTTTGSAPSF